MTVTELFRTFLHIYIATESSAFSISKVGIAQPGHMVSLLSMVLALKHHRQSFVNSRALCPGCVIPTLDALTADGEVAI